MGSVVPPLTSFPPVGGRGAATRGARRFARVVRASVRVQRGDDAPRVVPVPARRRHRGVRRRRRRSRRRRRRLHLAEAYRAAPVVGARGGVARVVIASRPDPGRFARWPRSRALRAVQEPPPDRASLRLGAVRRGGEERRVGRPQIRPAMAHARVPRRAVQRRVARPQVRPGGEGLRKQSRVRRVQVRVRVARAGAHSAGEAGAPAWSRSDDGEEHLSLMILSKVQVLLSCNLQRQRCAPPSPPPSPYATSYPKV